MKKNKTLPSNFSDLIELGDVEQLKKVFNKCELTAYVRGYYKDTALHFYGVPYEFMKWMLDRGYDPNTMSTYNVPLRYNLYDIKKVKLLLDYGADINYRCYNNNTPLHYLCDGNPPIENLKFFLQNGADINARNNNNETPLLYAIKRRRTPETRFVQMIETMLEEHSKIKKNSLLDKLRKINRHPIPDKDWIVAQKEITRIGKSHEFYKMQIEDENLRNETNVNMKRLYEIFEVEPVPERVMATENSIIKVTSTDWTKQYNELWNLLVPGSGRAEFLQGEAIRLIGKLSYEVLDMGCINWDKDFRKLVKAYKLLISYGNQLDKEDYDDVVSCLEDIKWLGEDQFNFVEEKTVEWILKNPKPVKLTDFKNVDFIKLDYMR